MNATRTRGPLWKLGEVDFLRRNVGKISYSEIAGHLKRSTVAVKAAAFRYACTLDRFWTEDDRQFAIDHFATMTTVAIAKHLKKSASSVYQLKDRMGLTKKRPSFDNDFKEYLLAKYAAGWSDAEIALRWGCERHTIGDWRKRLGMTANTWSTHQRDLVRQKTAEQLRKAGLPSIGWLRKEAFRKRAIEAGWPEDIRPRAVQILNALWERGPMTRREIADAIGMPWKGTRESLRSNDPEGSYLAHLMKRGLVVCMKRANKVTGKGRGSSTNVYTLPLNIERKTV